MRLFVFGVGYSSKAFVERVKDQFEWVGGTTRSQEKCAELSALGIEPFLFSDRKAEGDLAAALEQATHVLVSIGPDEQGDPALDAFADVLRKARPEWIGYLSTVGVYGNHDGEWVDEETPCRPVSKRSRQRVAAEEAWLSFANENELLIQIFRLSGIYGPGRNTFKKLRNGTARRLVKPGQVFNRIHVADIAGALEVAMRWPKSGIINVTDDEPAPPQDVVEYAARLLDVAVPDEVSFDEADLTPMARSFYGENKRVSNKKLQHEIGYDFLFPTYREGLKNLMNATEY
ncbi:MAG: SDR family oxidoreductase [Rhodobacteraceae bacterium]|nr:SDR family oxidoreductase [Paracoccaceae bacterium]